MANSSKDDKLLKNMKILKILNLKLCFLVLHMTR